MSQAMTEYGRLVDQAWAIYEKGDPVNDVEMLARVHVLVARAHELCPERLHARAFLGELLFWEGELVAARSHLESAALFFPRIQFLAGLVQYRVGHKSADWPVAERNVLEGGQRWIFDDWFEPVQMEQLKHLLKRFGDFIPPDVVRRLIEFAQIQFELDLDIEEPAPA